MTNQRLTLSLASKSGGMLLILFMVSISSLRSGWIWTNWRQYVKQLFTSVYYSSFTLFFIFLFTSSMALISSLSLSITVMNSWGLEKGRESDNEIKLKIFSSFHCQQQEISFLLSTHRTHTLCLCQTVHPVCLNLKVKIKVGSGYSWQSPFTFFNARPEDEPN